MKKIIGVVPASFPGSAQDCSMQDFYKIGNNYTKRLTEAECIPIALAPADNRIPEEVLDLCDGFLVQGGKEFYPYHFQTIHHAVTHGKRYLGICLGQQLIYAYFALRKTVEERGCKENVVDAICAYLEEMGPDFSVQKKVDGHYSSFPSRGDEDRAKHDVVIVPGTLLHRVLGRDSIRIATFHHLCTPPTQELVTINAWSAAGDNVVEGTEYKNHILGVQGHPEIDDLLPELFRFLAET